MLSEAKPQTQRQSVLPLNSFASLAGRVVF